MTGGHQHDFGVVEWIRPGEHDRVPIILEKMASLGARRLRTGISWADYHRPGGPEWFDWLVPALAAQVEVLPCFHYTPPSLGLAERSNAPPRDPKAFADFLDVFVTRQGEHFEWVELWNEPTNLLDWDWRLDPDWAIYTEMVGGAAYWMRQRGKKVLLGGNCPTDTNWLRHIAGCGVLDHVDAVGIHAFPGTWSIDWEGWGKELGVVRDTLLSCGVPRPLWITEAGFSTWRHDEAQQARELLAALDAPADRLYWYALEDLPAHVPTQQGFHVDERHYHMGLFRADHCPKLAARALSDGGTPRLAQTVSLTAPQLRRDVQRVVVTGGAGFLGANIADRLAADGHDVLLVDNLSRAGVEENARWVMSRHPRRVALETADVRDPHAAADTVRGAGAVLHLAAQVAVTSSLADPVADFEINARGTLNVLEGVRHGAPDAPVLFASTNKVYGELIPRDDLVREGETYRPRDPARRSGVDEQTPLSFHSPYGCSKGVADQYTLDYARVYGLKAAVLRMSCLYGPRQFGTEDQGWVAHFLLRALTGRPITIYGDGYQARDILFVDDAVAAWRAVWTHIDHTAGHAFNLGGGPANTISLRTLLSRLPELTGARPEIAHAPWRPGDQGWYVSDTTRLTAATGWRPRIDTGEGLTRLAAWLRTIAPSGEHEQAELIA